MQSAVEESGYGPRLQGTTGVRAGVQFYSGSGRHQRKRACDLGDPCGSAFSKGLAQALRATAEGESSPTPQRGRTLSMDNIYYLKSELIIISLKKGDCDSVFQNPRIKHEWHTRHR